jgi:hypothetical protein
VLSAGWVAIAPRTPVHLGGAERVGWWLVDPASGRTTDQMDDGRGVSATGHGRVIIIPVRAAPPMRRLGVCVAVVVLTAVDTLGAVGAGAAPSTSRAAPRRRVCDARPLRSSAGAQWRAVSGLAWGWAV